MSFGAQPLTTLARADDRFARSLSDLLVQAPDMTCILNGTQRYLRGDLRDATTAMISALCDAGLKPGEPVVIEICHSFELIVSICAVICAGGIVVPVDPALPNDRKNAIHSDVNPRLMIKRDDTGAGAVVLRMAGQPTRDPALAFLVYTSGSSGRPKGVKITRTGYFDRLSYITTHNPAHPNDVDLLWTPSSFIGMLDEVFFPLLLGVPIAIAPEAARADPNGFADLIAAKKVTTFRITPSLLNIFLGPQTCARLSTVRAIYCSGETIGAEVQYKVHKYLDATLIGFYGATEAPGVAYHVYDQTSDPLEISRCTPQPFARIEIVDEQGAAVAGDETGEILIGGLCVADGYWNQAELTAEKFQDRSGESVYQTGDLGRWCRNGQFEILGRSDMSEVNLRGVRIAILDVCQALKSLPDVEDAWVTVHQTDGRPDPFLVGHVTTSIPGGFDMKTARAALSEKIPTAALPKQCLSYDRFPLTANGKLDIQSLSAAGAKVLNDAPVSAPNRHGDPLTPQAQSVQPVVIDLTRQVLRCGPLNGSENFFELGGDSLSAVELSLLLNARLGANIAATAIFNSPTLNEIAEVITHGHLVEAGPCRLLRPGDDGVAPIFTLNATGNYTRLAKTLEYNGAIYNLNIFGLTNRLLDNLDMVTLADIAQHLADEVRLHHPTGPCKIMAFCQDGCLAVEVGKLLNRDAKAQNDLLLIDTFFTDHGTSLKMSLMRLIDFGPQYYLRELRKQLGLHPGPERIDRQAGASPEQSAALLDKSKNDGRLYRRYAEFFRTYRPERYQGDVHLFTSGEWRFANLGAVSRLADGQLSVTTFPGLHGNIFRDGHIQHIAAALDGVLSSGQRAVH